MTLTNLLVLEHTDVQLKDEFEAICTWASANKMVINISETKEIVFRRPNTRLDVDLPNLPRTERPTEAKLLDFVFPRSLHFDAQVNFVLEVCSQRSYILRKFRDKGLSSAQLNIVFDEFVCLGLTSVFAQ
jgi:ATP phosphoribosyltransferase